METRKAIGKNLDELIHLINEFLEVISVNLEVLEVLKLKGRIPLTDKRYIEINDLDKKHRRTFEKFLLKTVPVYLNSETTVTDKVLLKEYQLWAADLMVSLKYLDRIIKEFIQEQIEQDKKLKKAVKEFQVKDKRFWRFLDTFKLKTKVFDSFQEDAEDAPILEDEDPANSESKE